MRIVWQTVRRITNEILFSRIAHDGWHSSRAQHVIHWGTLWRRHLPLSTVQLHQTSTSWLDACCLPYYVPGSLWNFLGIYVSFKLLVLLDNLLVYIPAREVALEQSFLSVWIIFSDASAKQCQLLLVSFNPVLLKWTIFSSVSMPHGNWSMWKFVSRLPLYLHSKMQVSLPTCRETWDKSGRVLLRNVEALNWLTHKIHWWILIWWFFFSFNDKWNGYFFLNIFIPVTHHFIFFRSVDGILNPTIKNSHVPKWNYVLLRFQVN